MPVGVATATAARVRMAVMNFILMMLVGGVLFEVFVALLVVCYWSDSWMLLLWMMEGKRSDGRRQMRILYTPLSVSLK